VMGPAIFPPRHVCFEILAKVSDSFVPNVIGAVLLDPRVSAQKGAPIFNEQGTQVLEYNAHGPLVYGRDSAVIHKPRHVHPLVEERLLCFGKVHGHLAAPTQFGDACFLKIATRCSWR
jgi:hypothetical protein